LIFDGAFARLFSMRTALLLLLALAALPAVTTGTSPLSAPTPVSFVLPFSYIEGQTVPRREVRDPCIIREGDTYYLVFTMWPFSNREEKKLGNPNQGGSPGIALYASRNLKDWRFSNWLVKADELPEDCPYKNRFWAPEMHKINGKFYLIFTADNWIKNEYNPAGRWGSAGHAFVGVSDAVAGPYRNITWIPGGPCDTSLFGDTDGQIYAVMPKHNIYVQKLDLSRLSEGKVALVGKETLAVSCKSADTDLGDDDPNYLEGPWMIKREGKYHLFYAEFFDYAKRTLTPSRRSEYWTGVATADSPAGPWVKDRRGKVFQGGHLVVFDTPDQSLWLAHRGERGGPSHGLPIVTPFTFDTQGRVRIDAAAPTVAPASAPSAW
jgi:beta-xylosidase